MDGRTASHPNFIDVFPEHHPRTSQNSSYTSSLTQSNQIFFGHPFRVIPMTYAPQTTPFFRHRFLVRVSCKSDNGFVWYQIPTPIRTLFYSKPESGVPVTEMMTYDWSMIMAYVLMCFRVVT